MKQPDHSTFSLRSLATTVYLPMFCFSVGQGATIPIVALMAIELGASPAIAGLIVALRGLGTVLFDIPAGFAIGRWGERRAIAVSVAIMSGMALALAIGVSLPVYAGLIGIMGGAWAVSNVSRQAFATDASPIHARGRVMSTMGGVGRMGMLVGPLLGGLLITRFGLAVPFVLQAVLSIIGWALIKDSPHLASESSQLERPSVIELLRTHRRVLSWTGAAAMTIQGLRSARQAILPLWGSQIGVNASQVSFIFSASTAIEVLAFYPVGLLMDRKGRKWAALPSLFLLSLAIAVVPLSSDAVTLTLVGLFMGVANGLGAGVNMTIGSDLSPARGRSEFLGLWRAFGDVGSTGGPLLVAVVTSIATLAVASVTAGLVGFLGAVVLWWAVPETLAPKQDEPPP